MIDATPNPGPGPSGRRTFTYWLISLALAGSMLGIVLWQADSTMLAASLKQVDVPILVALLASYVGTIWLRAARFRLVLQPQSRTRDWFRLAALHNFYFTFVPFKLGETAFLPLALARSVPLAEAGLAMVLTRLFEGVVLLVIGLVGALSLGLHASIAPLAALLAIAVVLALALSRLLQAAGWVVARMRARWGNDRLQSAGRLVEAGRLWCDGQRSGQRRLVWLTLWVCILASISVYLAFFALGVTLTAPAVMFLYAGLGVFGALGVFTVAGVGVSELGLAGLLVLLGYPLWEATSLALLARLFLLAASGLGTGVILLATRNGASG